MRRKITKLTSILMIFMLVLGFTYPSFAYPTKKTNQDFETSKKVETIPERVYKSNQKVIDLKSLEIPKGNNENQQDNVAPDSEQLQTVNDLKKVSKKEINIHWNNYNGTPEVISGKFPAQGTDNIDKALKFLDQNKKLFKIKDTSKELKFNRTRKDNLGMEYVRIDQYHEGILIYGGQIVLQISPEGDILTVVSQFAPIKRATALTPLLTEQQALQKAKTELGLLVAETVYDSATVNGTIYGYQPKNEESIKLMYYPFKGQYHLAYEVKIDNWIIFVDATDGLIINKINNLNFEIVQASGNDLFGINRTFNAIRTGQIPEQYLYEMKEPDRDTSLYNYDDNTPLPGIIVNSNTNVFNNPSAVSGIYNYSRVYDWYKNTFGRNSYDNNWAPIIVTVNYPTSSYGWNAWWDTGKKQFVYTVAQNPTDQRPMTAALDIVGHEYTHAVVDSEVSLYYNTIEGGINESLADTMSIMIDADDWTQGEDAYTNGQFIRNFQNPTYKHFPEDVQSDPHDAGEILNFAAYKVTSALGRAKAQQVYYSTIMLLPDHAGAIYSSNMSNEETWKTMGNAWKLFRNTVEAATTNLYPADLKTVQNSYQQVGIGPLYDSSEIWEPNDYWWEAGSIPATSTFDSYISTSYDDDFYKINITSTGTLSLELTKLPADYDLVLYGPDLSVKTYSMSTSSADEDIIFPINQPGIYYVRILPYNNQYNKFSPYQLTSRFSTVIDSLEPDHLQQTNVSFGTIYTGYVIAPNDTDYYKVNVSAAGSIAVWMDSLPADYSAFLVDANDNILGGSTHIGNTPEWVTWWAPSAGTYYLIVQGNGRYSNSPYNIKFAYYTNKLDNHEPSDAFAYPKGPLISGAGYDGKIYNYVDQDFYKINVATAKTITITLSNLPADYDLYLYKTDGTFVSKSENAGTTLETIQAYVATGEYVIAILGYNGAYNQTNMYRLTANF